MIRDCPLKDRWIEYYNQQIPYQYRMDTRSETEKEQEQEQEQEHEQEKEQDQTEDGASAPPANAGQGGNGHPSTFQEWQEAIRESKNRPAVLHLMCEILYPGLSPPSYGYIGKVARKVGGAGRLADLLWQCTPHPPTGDLMAYIQKVAQNGKHSTKPERQTQEPAGVTGWTDS